MKLEIKVVPGASKDEIVGWLGERLKVRVSAPPENGKANAAVIKLVAKQLGVAKTRISIVAGSSTSMKTLEITGIDDQTATSLLPKRVD